MSRPPQTLTVLTASAILLAGCNSLTGVDQLTTSTGSSSGTGGASTTSATTSAAGGAGTGGSAPVMAAATGVSISQIALYQAVKRPLMGGDPSPAGITVPIVAGRDALVRVFADTDASYDGAPVTARLYLGQDAPLEVTAKVTAPSESTLASTLNFEVPGARLSPGTSFRVELVQPPHGAPDNPAARYPATGTEPLDIASDGPSFKVVIVPVQYDADGSHRLPDTSPSKIQGYKDWFYARYPAQKVDITVREPFPYGGTVFEFGYGWGALLDAVLDLRISDGVGPNVYYFGIVQPAATFDDYCIGGCTTGLANVGGASDEYAKAGIGLGYPGEDTLGTAVHEIGHALGRTHAPCGGASGADPSFPYDAGGIGVWGYDLVTKQLVSPDAGKDMMGYCDPYWISDYTFLGIFNRLKTVNNAHHPKPSEKRVDWARARVEADGSLTPLSTVSLGRPAIGEPVPVTVIRGGVASVVPGQFYPYDHLAGGVLLWPRGEPMTGISVTLGGKTGTLAY